MPNAAPEDAPVVKWAGEAFRLIPSRFPPVNVYHGLIANDRLDEVAAVEDLTNPRLRSLERISRAAKADPAADPRLQNWNLAPFAYGNPDGSTFFDEGRPCLELSLDRQTALAVSVERRQTFLGATQQAPTAVEMRMLCTPVEGSFWDLRGMPTPPAGLDAPERRALAAGMPTGVDGIIYRPAERPAGTCVAVLSGEALRRSTQTVHYRYVWDGARIALIYAFDKAGTPIDPELLQAGEDIAVAA